MNRRSRARDVVLALGAAAVLAACTPTASEGASATPSVSPAESAPSSAAPSSTNPTPSPTVVPTPPPLTPGTARGQLLVVQQSEDASLVSGEQPIRLTLARTGNVASWFTSPPQKLAGTMSTEQALLTLGWRPADDGTTSVLRNPRPNGLLAHAGGALAFTVQRANVRADGTLVLDIRPIGGLPETVESFGPVSLTLDGAPGVLDLDAELGDLSIRVIVTGERSQQAVVQVSDGEGEVLESGFVTRDRATLDTWLDVTAGATVWSDPVVEFTPPEQGSPGTVRVRGTLTVDGQVTQIDQVIARWSLPLG